MILATSETQWAVSFDVGGLDFEPSPLTEPEIPGYRLLRKVGQGGMGIVYLATNLASGRRCAVKVIRADRADSMGIERFQNEADVLLRLSHPAIVRLIETGYADNGLPYLAMEYVAGRNLEDVVREEGPLSSRQVASVLRQMCRALAEVHARGMVHRDIKPANIIEGGCQARRIVTLIDFGLAQSATDVWNDEPGEASFIGSPLYSAPEASLGAFDWRSDIYSLGATAYHLLTGRPVFDADHPLAAIVAHAEHEPISLWRVASNVSLALNAIVMKCLQKRPEDRYQSVEEFDAALAWAI